MLFIEVYKSIIGFSGYLVSNLGNIKSVDRIIHLSNNTQRKVPGKKLKPSNNTWGYPFVSIRGDNGKKINRPIHRMVAEAFIFKIEGKPCVNHIDGNKENNVIYNLEWCDYSENEKHSYRIGIKTAIKGQDHVNAKLNDSDVAVIKILLKEGNSQQSIADKFNVSRKAIGLIGQNINWRHI